MDIETIRALYDADQEPWEGDAGEWRCPSCDHDVRLATELEPIGLCPTCKDGLDGSIGDLLDEVTRLRKVIAEDGEQIVEWKRSHSELCDEVLQLRDCLTRANANHEEFERRWYLARDEAEELRARINTPRTDDFFEAVRNEAAHQNERWGTEHDAGKRAEDWVALVAYLLGKATKAHYEADDAKLKYHVVTIGAVCLNWLRNLNGETTLMRPGVAPRECRGEPHTCDQELVAAAEGRTDRMIIALDEALRLLDGCVDDLARREPDPSMLDGHRERIAELRKERER